MELIRDTEADVQALPAWIVCVARALTCLACSAVVSIIARLGACTATWGLQRFQLLGRPTTSRTWRLRRCKTSRGQRRPGIVSSVRADASRQQW